MTINTELLEALKDLYVLVQVTPSVLPQLLKAEAAIAKAESAVSEPVSQQPDGGIDYNGPNPKSAVSEPTAWTATRIWNRLDTFTCPADIERLLSHNSEPAPLATEPAICNDRHIAELKAASIVLRKSDGPVTFEQKKIAIADAIDAAMKALCPTLPTIVYQSDDLTSLKPKPPILFTPAAPLPEPLTKEAYTALAHRIASKYAHRSDPQYIAYTFLPHTLEDFVRAIENAHNIGEKQ